MFIYSKVISCPPKPYCNWSDVPCKFVSQRPEADEQCSLRRLYFLLILFLSIFVFRSKRSFIIKSQSLCIINLLKKLSSGIVCIMNLFHFSGKFMSLLLISMVVINFLESLGFFNFCKLLPLFVVTMFDKSLGYFLCTFSLFISFSLNIILVLDSNCCKSIDCLLSSHF